MPFLIATCCNDVRLQLYDVSIADSVNAFHLQGLDAAGFEPYVHQLEKNFAKGIRLGVESGATEPQVSCKQLLCLFSQSA